MYRFRYEMINWGSVARGRMVRPGFQDNVPLQVKTPKEAARIIRSKNAGINKFTFDIFFTVRKDYEAALNSDLFTADNVARIFDIPLEWIIGTYRADDCYAIKISIHRDVVSGSPRNRDIFGAQQHMLLMRLKLPVFAE